MDRSPIVAGIVSAHNKKATHKDLSVEGHYCEKTPKPPKPQKPGYTRTKFYVLKWKPIPSCMPLRWVVQLPSRSRVSAAAEASLLLSRQFVSITGNDGGTSGSRPCRYRHAGVLILPLQSRRPPPLQLHHRTTPVVHSKVAKAFFADVPCLEF